MMRSLLLFLLPGPCALAEVHAAEQDLYNPLAVGLHWDLDVQVISPDGKTIQGSAAREIIGTDLINKITYFVVRTEFKGVPQIKDFVMYRRKAARGVFAISALDREKREILEVALPMVVGQSWKTYSSGLVITSTVQGKESVTVGGKTYEDCMKVSYKTDAGISGTYYQAPDIGNVLETTMANGSTYKFSLKAFSGLK